MRIALSLVTGALRNRKGAVLPMVALAMPAMAGAVALAVEAGLWMQTRSQLQSMVDASALAAARELAESGSEAAAIAAAETLSSLNDCGSTCQLTSVVPDSATNTVTVEGSAEVPLYLAKLFMGDQDTMNLKASGKAQARSVEGESCGGSSSGGGTGCILGLDPNAAYTVWLKNNAELNCGAVSNSRCQGKDSPTCSLDADTYGGYSCSPNIDPQCNASLSDDEIASLFLWNNARINGDATAAGGITLRNNAEIEGEEIANATTVDDPYGSVSISAPTATAAHTVGGGNGSSSSKAIDISVADGTCSTDEIKYKNNKYLNIQPGCYNGWDFMNNVFITLSAGTYYIKSGFVLGNNAKITATAGTTIVFVGDYEIDVGNNAFLTITAPSSGNFSGIALMGDPSGKATAVQTFSNNAILDVKGAIYFRNQIVNMENNSISSSSGCLQLIGRRVLFSNNATLGDNCGSIGTSTISLGRQVTTCVEADLVQQ